MEKELQKECIKILNKLNITFFHISSIASKKNRSMSGFPDLLILNNNYWYAVELKDGSILRDNQKETLRKFYDNGAIVKIITSVDAFIAFLAEYNII